MIFLLDDKPYNKEELDKIKELNRELLKINTLRDMRLAAELMNKNYGEQNTA